MVNRKKIFSGLLLMSVSICSFGQQRVEKLSNEVVTGFEQMAKIERLPLLYPYGTKKTV